MSDDRRSILDMLADRNVRRGETRRMLDPTIAGTMTAQEPGASNTGTMPTGLFWVPVRKV